MYTFGFIGCGNMGGALASAAAKSGKKIALADKNTEKLNESAKLLNATATQNKDIAKNSRFIVLGVKPQMLSAVLDDMAKTLKLREDRFAVISMAAGVSTDSICEMLGFNVPVIRIMPNTPAEIGKGTLLYCKNECVEQEEIEIFKTGFNAAGIIDETSEKLIDAASAISGCGPAFVYMFIEALADGGVKCGLPRDKAQKYAASTVLGAAAMVLQTERHPGSLKDAVCSPAGSTIEGVNSLENSGFRAAVIDAVSASYKRTLELGKSRGKD
jgi:pyrroline-5-carboxylate reductase